MKVALFAIVLLTVGSFSAAAQNLKKTKMKKVLFVLTSHSNWEHRRKNRILG
jgi:hypothetical protein